MPIETSNLSDLARKPIVIMQRRQLGRETFHTGETDPRHGPRCVSDSSQGLSRSIINGPGSYPRLGADEENTREVVRGSASKIAVAR